MCAHENQKYVSEISVSPSPLNNQDQANDWMILPILLTFEIKVYRILDLQIHNIIYI